MHVFLLFLQAMEFLSQVGCTTTLVEKGHAPANIIKRGHKKLEAQGLKLRAYIYIYISLQAPLFKLSRVEQQILRLRAEYDELLNSTKMNKTSAKMQFFSEMIRGKVALPDDLVNASVPTLCHHHHGMYAKLDDRAREALGIRAVYAKIAKKKKQQHEG